MLIPHGAGRFLVGKGVPSWHKRRYLRVDRDQGGELARHFRFCDRGPASLPFLCLLLHPAVPKLFLFEEGAKTPSGMF